MTPFQMAEIISGERKGLQCSAEKSRYLRIGSRSPLPRTWGIEHWLIPYATEEASNLHRKCDFVERNLERAVSSPQGIFTASE
ncbi:hypothetical protein Poly51_12650 [Rubripirellula tenax]|uniref:Uncharacterized protein n=1 Tax=Rubripirellula tenax TaxID=2528015 RepID=A0A5C6FCW7_9BACT|nr:hypothetical protein Poly51_12650 [Rubripirellula tenax]